MDHDQADCIRITPHRSWLVQLVGAAGFALVIGIVLEFNVKDSFWQTAVPIGIVLIVVTVVAAVRRPWVCVCRDGLWIRRFIGSISVQEPSLKATSFGMRNGLSEVPPAHRTATYSSIFGHQKVTYGRCQLWCYRIGAACSLAKSA